VAHCSKFHDTRTWVQHIHNSLPGTCLSRQQHEITMSAGKQSNI
jgi:hypothetical protein